MRLFSLLPAAVICAAVFACSETPDPNDPSQFNPNAGYGAQYPGQYPTATNPGAYPTNPGAYPTNPGAYPTATNPGAYPTAAPPATYPTAPQPTAAPPAGGGKATAAPPYLAAAAQPVLAGLAQQHARGMKSDGAAFAAQFQQGQTFEQPFQIQPGRCYAVIGVGMGIQELDVQLVIHQPPLPPYVAAQDQTSGSQAVLGGGGNCFRNPLPMGGPAKVIMTARAGAGVAMAQIFSKSN